MTGLRIYISQPKGNMSPPLNYKPVEQQNDREEHSRRRNMQKEQNAVRLRMERGGCLIKARVRRNVRDVHGPFIAGGE